MSKAGDNEKKFIKMVEDAKEKVKLNGKKRYLNNSVSISVDESFIFDGIEYLIEIDSGNMAKLLVGQYILLNELYNGEKEKVVFIIIHAYKNYKVERTNKNLELVEKNIYKGKGIKYYVIKFDDLVNDNKIKLMNIVKIVEKKSA